MSRTAAALLLFVLMACRVASADTEAVIQGVPLSQLIQHLRGTNEESRLMALMVLDGAGQEAAAAVPALIELLDSGEPQVRGLTASVLTGIGPAAAAATPKLQQMAEQDPDALVRGHVQMALMEIGAPLSATTGAGAVQPVLQVPEPVVPTADPGVTAYLQPLRGHKAKLTTIRGRLDALATSQPQDNAQARQWATDLKSTGNDLAAEVRALQSTLHDFVNSRTRRGLTEELGLIGECLELAGKGADALATRTDFDVPAYVARQNLRQEATAQRTRLLGLLAEEVDYRLEAEGLLALLTTEGIGAMKTEVVSRLRSEAEQELDRLTERELGIGFHDARSFGSAVRHKARSALRTQVRRLLFTITGNEIIVELLAVPIIRWIETDLWPKLKELFRNKGDLDFRAERSVGTFESARMRLWSLQPTATLDQVRAALRNAEGTRHAARYLIGDVTRAGRQDLLVKIQASDRALTRAMNISEQRFLLHKLEELEKVEPQEEAARALAAVIEAMVRGIEIPAVTQVTPPPDERDEPERPEEILFGPRYLVHIILTHTTGGPVEKDTWILHPGKPNEDGVILTADGYGGSFTHKADDHRGPFTSSYQLAPVLVELGIRSMWIGRLYIDANPEVWGN